MTFTLHPQAEQDLERAFRFYTRHAGSGVARRFLDEFERVATFLDGNPSFGSPTRAERRSFPMRVYPYAVIYKPLRSGIRILVVRHHRLAPGYGEDRG